MSEEEKKTSYKRLTPAQWEQIVVLWEFGKTTAEDLAGVFEVSVTAIKKGLKKRGAVKGSRAHEVGEAAATAAKDAATERIERIGKMKDQYLGWNDLLAKLTIKEIHGALKEDKPLAGVKDNLLAINKAVANIKMLRDENYHLLGLYDENPEDEELPELVIGEYSAEELSAIQANYDAIEDDLDELLDEEDEAELEDLKLPFKDEEDE